MDHYAGIDVSLEYASVCVVEASGKIVREGKVLSEPAALIAWFCSLGFGLARIGLEAGPLSQWLYAGLKQAGLAVELLETRHVHKALETMPVKTDRNDARGIAQLMRLGWFKPVHCKSLSAQETRAMLTARKLIQAKLFDVEMSLRGILRGFGLKVGKTTARSFAARIEGLVAGHPSLQKARGHHASHARRRKTFQRRGQGQDHGCSRIRGEIARVLGRATAPGLPRREVPSPGRWIRSGRHPGCGIRPRIRRLADLSSPHPIRRRPCADPVQKQVSGEWMTQKGIDSSRPVTEARMERSKIRGCCVAYEKPGFRCAPSGLRLLRCRKARR